MEKRKRISYLLFVITAAISIFFVACGSSSSNDSSEEIKISNDEYFAIGELLNNKKFDEAKEKMDKAYEDIGYQEGDGINKLIQYSVYYDKQGDFESEAKVFLDFLKANEEDIKTYIKKKDSIFFNSSSLKNPSIVNSGELDIIADFFKEHKKDVEEETYQQVEQIIGELMN